MILDAHCHLGRDVVYDFTVTEEQLLSVHSAHGITGGIVQPTITRPYLSEARAAHDRIRRFADSAPGKYWGMVSLLRIFPVRTTLRRYTDALSGCILLESS